MTRMSHARRGGAMIRAWAIAGVALFGLSGRVHAVTITMQPLTSFGASGWLSGTAIGLPSGTNNSFRGMAFNPATNDLLLANGSTLVPVNSSTGTVGTSLTSTGVSGGARALNSVAVTSDGVIYGANLTTSSTASATPFKVYRWENQAATPTTHYSGNGGRTVGAPRLGDDAAAFGPDGTGLLAFGSGTGSPSFSTMTTGTGGGVANPVNYSGQANGDFRLSITFADADTVLGTQAQTVRQVSFSGTAGILDFSTLLNTTTERGLIYFNAYGTPLIATQEWGSGATTNTVRLYDATNLLTSGSITYITQANLTTGTVANANATGGMAFGVVNGTPTIYAMSTNNGIQALQIVPEPTTTVAAGLCSVGLAMMMLRRRRGQDE